MSRCYEMSVEIEGFNPDKESEIIEAADNEWNFENWFKYKSDGPLTANGDGNLCGGELEDEFVRRLSRAVWKANGAYCRVGVGCTYLEDLPYDYYELSEDEFDTECLRED